MAAAGDAAEFLDVDVDQFAGPGAFVAAHGLAGGPVAGGQGVQAVPDRDAVGGRGGGTETTTVRGVLMRLPLGEDEVSAVLAHLDQVREDVAAWEERTRLTGFDA